MKKNMNYIESFSIGAILGMIFTVVLMNEDSLFVSDNIKNTILYITFCLLAVTLFMRIYYGSCANQKGKSDLKIPTENKKECIECEHRYKTPGEYPCNICDIKIDYRFEPIKP